MADNIVFKLYKEKLFCFDVVLFENSSIMDQNFDMFLGLFEAAKNSYKANTKICFTKGSIDIFIESHLKDDDQLYDRALKAKKIINKMQSAIQIYDCNSISKIIVDLIRNHKKVSLISESMNAYRTIKEDVEKECGNVDKVFSLFKIHSFIANEIYGNLDYAANLQEEKKVVLESKIKKVGDTVFDSKGRPIVLKQTIGKKGGEAFCYVGSNGFVCKIFHPANNTNLKRDKILEMIKYKREFAENRIVWPIDSLYDKPNGVFVGYYMNEIKNAFPVEMVSYDAKDRSRYLQNRVNNIKLCINIAELFVKLHENYIVVGDISYKNILFDKTFNAYIIDTDSIQIRNHFCDLGTEDFVAPEQIDNNYDKVKIRYRTEQSELFILARVMFQLLIGDDPYSCPKNISESMIMKYKKGIFPYPLESASKGGDYSMFEDPNSEFRCIAWDILPQYLKQAFYDVFSKDGYNYKIGYRFPAYYWKKQLLRYLDELQHLAPGAKELQLYPGFNLKINSVDTKYSSQQDSASKNKQVNKVVPPPSTNKNPKQENLANSGSDSFELNKKNMVKRTERIKNKYFAKYKGKLSNKDKNEAELAFKVFISQLNNAKNQNELDKVMKNVLKYRQSRTANKTSSANAPDKDENKLNQDKSIKKIRKKINKDIENLHKSNYSGLTKKELDEIEKQLNSFKAKANKVTTQSQVDALSCEIKNYMNSVYKRNLVGIHIAAISDLQETLNEVVDSRHNPFVKQQARKIMKRYVDQISSLNDPDKIKECKHRGIEELKKLIK